MFEALLSLCLISEPASCRDVLLPGFEADAQEACEDRVTDTDWKPRFPQYLHNVAPECRLPGPTADFVEIADGVFAHRGIVSDAAEENYGDVSNVGFVIGAKSIAVIDTGGSRKIAEMIYRAIRQHSDLPISYAILTHMHPDHVLGASVFADAGAKIIGHPGLARALADRAETYQDNFGRLIGAGQFIGTRIVVPDVVVDEVLQLDLGERMLALRTWPRAHTGTDLTVMDQASGTLFTGDLVFDKHAPALDGSLVGWQSVLAELMTLDAARIVPGHGGPVLDWPAGAEALARYLDVLAEDTRAVIDEGQPLSEAVDNIARSEASNWQLFDLFNPRNATVAYTELEWE